MPETLDSTIEYALILFGAKVTELSEDNLTILQVPMGDFSKYEQKEADLYMLTVEQVVSLDDRTSFTQLPFLFENGEMMFHYLNNPDTALRRSSATKENLDGEIVMVYEGNPYWFIGRNKLYPEIGFVPSVGITEGTGDELFMRLGATTVSNNEFENLEESYVGKDVKFLEMVSTQYIIDDVLDATNAIVDVGHRYDSWWMIAREKENLNDYVMSIIHESAAYTLLYQKETRDEMNQARMNALYKQTDSDKIEFDYNSFFSTSAKFYEKNYKQMNIPLDIWQEISPFIQISK